MSIFEQMKQIVDRLKSLLDNPEPGMFTWHQCVHECFKEIDRIRLLTND